MFLSASVANQPSSRFGASGSAAEHPDAAPARVGGSASLHPPPAANDNKAPLLQKLRRLVFATVAALAVAWLFWVGLLR